MLSEQHGKNLNQLVDDYVVFDLETTGISPSHDEVIEISAVKVKNGKVVDEFSTLVDPGCPISAGASAVNGITDDMVCGAPGFAEVLPNFLDFIGDMTLVGHNIEAFDLKFIYRGCQTSYGKKIDNDYVDTLMIARKCLPELAHHKMTDLAVHYGISTDGAHRALKDCQMTQQVFEQMREDMRRLLAGEKTVKKCPECGKKLKLRNGKFGEFYGCAGYPRCRYTERLT